jgi:hypothetical protein
LPPAVIAKWRSYRDMSNASRFHFRLAETVAIVGAAAVPVAAAANLQSWIIAAVGAVVLVATGMRTAWGVHADWIEHARVRYGIERELSLFSVSAHPYDSDDALPLLVTNVERLTSEEIDHWAARRSSIETQLSQRNRGS